MAEIGDTRIIVGAFAPEDDATGVAYDLSEVSCFIRVDEYYDPGGPPVGWYTGASQYITSIGAITIAMSGGISMDTPSGVIGNPQANTAGITSLSGEDFAGNTEYTWNFNSVSLTHGTVTFGSVTRSYSTDVVSFTTGDAPTPDRQINLSSPANTATGIILQPLLQWTISGDGAQDGDLLDIYLRKDDASFTSADQLGFLVDATLNSSWQIVGGLEYNSTYYWQVQAAESTSGDLLSSSVYSFTTTTFRPPAISTGVGGASDFTGENNMLTVNRLISAANNRIWYEDI